jgi:predicted transposase YbfD/YdcC
MRPWPSTSTSTAFRRGAAGRADCDAFDGGHGRLVRRRVFASLAAAELEALSAWPGLHTVLAVEAIRSVNGTPEVKAEIRYFLSSCRDDPAVLAQAIRTHWDIENALHWVLDVTSREDDSRVRDRSSQASIRAKRKGAAWNDSYMLQLLVS